MKFEQIKILYFENLVSLWSNLIMGIQVRYDLGLDESDKSLLIPDSISHSHTMSVCFVLSSALDTGTVKPFFEEKLVLI